MAPPVADTRLKQIATDACDSALSNAESYNHTLVADWNSTIINTILKSLISETSSGPTSQPSFKYAVNSTIIQHLSPVPGSSEPVPVGRRGMHSAVGAYWNNEKDGMWSFKYEGGDKKGMDIVISVINARSERAIHEADFNLFPRNNQFFIPLSVIFQISSQSYGTTLPNLSIGLAKLYFSIYTIQLPSKTSPLSTSTVYHLSLPDTLAGSHPLQPLALALAYGCPSVLGTKWSLQRTHQPGMTLRQIRNANQTHGDLELVAHDIDEVLDALLAVVQRVQEGAADANGRGAQTGPSARRCRAGCRRPGRPRASRRRAGTGGAVRGA
ncbi:uncharacterized protein K441DRAFT_701716 [Cenococcum geophilum 1.58]|uniref:Uncharacterized protein n=1 Tax=Cenococcum geophilum 1.58 TaxID=794803 RepID=A0ACC8EKW2_9PEZI|nr:hypothetical protein K441DRAFT_701716 [Cenococcum geophilum 1.58]